MCVLVLLVHVQALISLERYIINGLDEEAVQGMRSIVHPNAMGEIVKVPTK